MLLLLFTTILLTLAAVYLYLAYQLGTTSVNAAILLVVRGMWLVKGTSYLAQPVPCSIGCKRIALILIRCNLHQPT